MAFHHMPQKNPTQVTDNDYQDQRGVTFQNDMRYLRAVLIHSANDVLLPTQRNKRDNPNTNKYRDISRVYRCSTCRYKQS